MLLIAATLIASWLGMQAVHELGHVAGAFATGGRVERVVLDPLSLSRTDLADNPSPLAVAWAGPLVGVLLPLTIWTFAAAIQMPLRYLARFFAGFCLVANGVYIGSGVFGGMGDTDTMLRHGSSRWPLALFGAVTVPLGFWLWHRQGGHFGLGAGRRDVSGRAYRRARNRCLLTTGGLAAGLWFLFDLTLVPLRRAEWSSAAVDWSAVAAGIPQTVIEGAVFGLLLGAATWWHERKGIAPTERRVDALVSAWNAGDSIRFGACFTEDARYRTGDGTRARGRLEISGLVPAAAPAVPIEIQELRITPSRGGVTASFIWEAREPARRGTITCLVVRRNGEWLIRDLRNAEARAVLA
jgi:hypothetical protein